MDYMLKTKEQLINELMELQQKMAAENKNYIQPSNKNLQIESNEALLRAINQATAELIANNDLDSALEIGFAFIGKSCSVNKVYLCKNQWHDSDNSLQVIQKTTWNSDFYAEKINNNTKKNIPFAKLDILMETITKGNPFIKTIRQIEPCETRSILQIQGILSILAIPVFINNNCWGFIGIEDYNDERDWTNDEISILTSYVNSIGKIIERNTFKQNLIESVERYKRITDGITDYLYKVIVKEGRAIETIHNLGCLSITGYSSMEFEQDPYLWINMVVPEEREQIASRFTQILAGKDLPNTIEHRIICKDGKIKWVSDTTIPKLDEKGQIISYEGVIKDITERKQAEKALQISEEKFRLLFDTMTESVALNQIVYDEQGEMVDYKIIEVNKAYYSTTDLSEEQVINNLATNLYGMPKDLIHSFWKKHKEINETEYTEMPSPLNNKFYYVSTSPFVNDCFVTVFFDITERKLAEEALRENEKKYRQLVEILNEGIWAIDKNDITTFVNPHMAEMLGYTVDEMIGKSLFLFMDEQGIEICKKYLVHRKIGIKEQHDFEFIKKDGSRVFVIMEVAPIIDKDGFYSGALAGIVDITERKKVEQIIKASEEKYRLIAENTTDVIWTYSIENERITYISPSIIHLTGFTVEESLEQNLQDMLGIETAELLIQRLKNRIANYYAGDNSEKTKVHELQQICKDKSTIWIEMVTNFIFDSQGIITGIMGISRNIQKRKKNERKLERSQNRYRTISRLSSDFSYSCIHGINGYEVDWITEAFFSITGYTRQELKQNKCWLFAAHPDERKEAIIRFNKINIGENLEMEFRIVSKNGVEHTIINRMECMEDPELPGRKRIFGAVQDISERKKAEEELIQNETRLRSLVDIFQFDISSTQDILNLTLEKSIHLTKSKIGYIYFYDENKAEFTLFSWSKEVMKECTIFEPQTIYQLEKTGIWGEAVRQRKPIMINDFQVQYALKKGYPEGHVQLHKFLTVPVFSNNNIVAVAGVANKEIDYDQADILHLTLLMNSVWKVIERKNMELELKEKNQELTEINLDKDRFVSILAHDLKSPFNSILGYLGLLSKNIRKYDIDKIENQINIINSTAQNTFNLLESILLWAHTQSGKINFEPLPLHIASVYNDVMQSLRLNADNKKIQVNYIVDEDIMVIADLNMLSTILRNLISNAIKFTNIGGQVHVVVLNRQSDVEITVSDNGIGIEPENIPKLFDYSLIYTSNGTSNEKGTGLGLVLCKEFVEKHGGEIWLQSQLGKGSEFKFTLPKH